MYLFVAAALFLVSGMTVGFFLLKAAGSLLGSFDPVRTAVSLLIFAPLCALSGYALSELTGVGIIFYFGLFVSGVLFTVPALALIGIWLLWWNPEKYKEYEMKQLRKQRELRVEAINYVHKDHD